MVFNYMLSQQMNSGVLTLLSPPCKPSAALLELLPGADELAAVGASKTRGTADLGISSLPSIWGRPFSRVSGRCPDPRQRWRWGRGGEAGGRGGGGG